MPRQYTPRVDFQCPACSRIMSIPPSVAANLRVCSEACRGAAHPEISVTGTRRGVYAIIHRDSGRAYVGSSVHVRARLLQHLKHLQRGTSPHPGILTAWREFGSAAFDFTLIEEVAADASLFDREQFWMDRFRNQSGVFNSHPRADTPLGTKRTRDAVIGISRGKLGSRNPAAKLTDQDVEDIKARLISGESMSSIARSYNVSITPIYTIKRGEWSKEKCIEEAHRLEAICDSLYVTSKLQDSPNHEAAHELLTKMQKQFYGYGQARPKRSFRESTAKLLRVIANHVEG